MSDRVTIHLGVDTTEAETNIQNVQQKVDNVVRNWRLSRREILQGVREVTSVISSMVSSYRQFMSIIGQQVDPFFSALISMTLSTISMILSISAALAATGLGAGAAVAMGVIGISLNTMVLTKLLLEKERTTGMFSKIGQDILNTLLSGLSEQSAFGG